MQGPETCQCHLGTPEASLAALETLSKHLMQTYAVFVSKDGTVMQSRLLQWC